MKYHIYELVAGLLPTIVGWGLHGSIGTLYHCRFESKSHSLKTTLDFMLHGFFILFCGSDAREAFFLGSGFNMPYKKVHICIYLDLPRM